MLKQFILISGILLINTSSFFANPKDSIDVRPKLKYIQPKIHSLQINIATPILKGSTFIYDDQFLAESSRKNDGTHFNLIYQYNLTKNYFLETFLNYNSTQTSVIFSNYIVRNYSVVVIEDSKQTFWNVGLGGGYRLISENHKRLLDLNFGLNFIHAQNILGNTTFDMVSYYQRDKSIEISLTQKDLNSYLFGFYLGASKEFRLHKGLHLLLSYQHRYIRSFLSKDEIEYNFVDENLSGKVDAYNTLDRSFLMLGLKYYLAK
jgi:hypothetical protein